MGESVIHWADVVAELTKRGYSLASIADREGVGRPAVTRVLRGELVSHRIAYAIAELSGIPTEKIWPGKYLAPPAYAIARKGHSVGRLPLNESKKAQRQCAG